MRAIDTQLETKILALIARGDSYDNIVDTLTKDGQSVNKNTIVSVKKRNSETLKYMQNAMVQHELNKSTQLLARSRQLLEKKIQRALLVDDKLEELKEMLNVGDITAGEYHDLVKLETKNDISVAVLTTLSKEMFNQSQLEQRKPTSITESPAEARENLKTLLQAIDAKDEKAIVKALFIDDQPIPVQE